ncbi:MAG: molecular chaperone HtpG, partial [Roseburia sp.]|nr:molecular chaperone HtpG [Roseburia sp.]
FIADNIKEVIPEFLMLLNGVIDCPDIPLNVSRSFLQNDKQVQKISKHITKKVADKLVSLFKNDREKFEACWGDVANFVKFGCIKDESFYDKVKDIIIYKDINGKFLSFNELLGTEVTGQPVDETAQAEGDKDKKPTTVYYVSDEGQQAQYVKLFKDQGLNAVLCDNFIDPHFLSFLEYKAPLKMKFMRIDADIDGALKSSDGAEDSVLIDIFKNAIGKENLTIKTEELKNGDVPAVIVVDEYMRRYTEMGQIYGMSDGQLAQTLIINTACPVIKSLKELDEERQKFVAYYVYSLSLNSFKKLSPDELDKFQKDNLTLLNNFIK